MLNQFSQERTPFDFLQLPCALSQPNSVSFLVAGDDVLCHSRQGNSRRGKSAPMRRSLSTSGYKTWTMAVLGKSVTEPLCQAHYTKQCTRLLDLKPDKDVSDQISLTCLECSRIWPS